MRINTKSPMKSTVEALTAGPIHAIEVNVDVNADAFPSVMVRIPLEDVELQVVDE